jgi:GMP synthase-like glutamine amidotransferase
MLLASGTDVHNQAFSVRNALGLQFHLELTEMLIQDWSKNLRRFQQGNIVRDTPRYLPESNRLCRMIAENFTSS